MSSNSISNKKQVTLKEFAKSVSRNGLDAVNDKVRIDDNVYHLDEIQIVNETPIGNDFNDMFYNFLPDVCLHVQSNGFISKKSGKSDNDVLVSREATGVYKVQINSLETSDLLGCFVQATNNQGTKTKVSFADNAINVETYGEEDRPEDINFSISIDFPIVMPD